MPELAPPPAPSSSPPPSFAIDEFQRAVRAEPTIAIAVAAMQALTAVVRESRASTMMGLEKELQESVDALKSCNPASISLAAGCELFSRHVTRTALDTPQFSECVNKLVERGQFLASLSAHSRQTIAHGIEQFITNGTRILVHGLSRVVMAALFHAHRLGKHFSIIVTEGRPDCDGYKVVSELGKAGIPCTLIVDSAIGYTMERVDIVLVGAEGVVESGGVINKIGTYSLCVMASAFKRPVYVCAECYKFARLFPLHQKDLPEKLEQQLKFLPASATISDTEAASLTSPSSLDRRPVIHPYYDKSLTAVRVENPSCDYTPPQYITLLFTDLGILTPSAVSDELIKLYY